MSAGHRWPAECKYRCCEDPCSSAIATVRAWAPDVGLLQILDNKQVKEGAIQEGVQRLSLGGCTDRLVAM